MIIGAGICMLIIGLIGIVILQLARKRLTEGFVFNNGAGCVENKCKLNKASISEADYKEWCDQCTNCKWDDVAKDCNPDPSYVPTPKDSSTDNATAYCKAGCTNIDGERACNACPSCVSCVKADSNNPDSDNHCIDRKDYTPELCPGTDDSDLAPSSDVSNICNTSCDRIDPKNGTCDQCPNCKSCWPEPGTNGNINCINKTESCPAGTSTENRKYYFDTNGNRKYPTGPEEQEARRSERDAIDTADTMDYTNEESAETAKAKAKNNESKFLRDFQSIVHNEVLNEQGMTTANSQEYLRDKARRRKENMKPNRMRGCPDMSEYVRKDSIPCWGCTLD